MRLSQADFVNPSSENLEWQKVIHQCDCTSLGHLYLVCKMKLMMKKIIKVIFHVFP